MSELTYQNLSNRINKVINDFDSVSTIENETITPELVQDIIRSVILLAHAEFEFYIENLAKNIVERSKAHWNTHKTADYHASTLFITAKLENKDNWNTKANKIFSDHLRSIDSNHGIKEDNIKKLFTPLGLPINHFDAIFVGNINTFGSKRGQIAHTGVNSMQNQLDFHSEKAIILGILAGIQDFENSLSIVPGTENNT